MQLRSTAEHSLKKMATVEGEFIFDAVGGFLTSPIWNYPVRTFIEQNSLGKNSFPL